MNHKINYCVRNLEGPHLKNHNWLFNDYDQDSQIVCTVGAYYVHEAGAFGYKIVPLHTDKHTHYTHKKYWHTHHES